MKNTSAAGEESSSSSYYPGCRKDANCSCKICLASINATLDLMPFSVQKSSLTRLSSVAATELTPISFASLSTPTSRSTRTPSPPPPPTPPPEPEPEPEIAPPPPPHAGQSSSARSAGGGPGVVFLVLLGVLMAEFGAFSGVSKPVFSRGLVRSVGEKAWGVKGLNGKLRFLERSLEGLVPFDRKVFNCSHSDSTWEITQDGLLVNSHCKLYKSLVEEIRIWGWPLQTAGLLVTGSSSRSFTVISGRVTEWSDGKIGYVTRKANSTWTHPKWGSSAVQLDPNTWILEYRRNSILESPRLVSATVAFLKHRASRVLGQMAQDFWVFFSLEKTQCCSFGTKSDGLVPT